MLCARTAPGTPPGYPCDQTASGGNVHGYTENRDAYLRRMRRIEGQVRGIARMIEEDKYCIDI
ncbi:MAG TPA: metal-sensitive transcriptional regulator, partial [Jatrophihabitantaceae bacterium]